MLGGDETLIKILFHEWSISGDVLYVKENIGFKMRFIATMLMVDLYGGVHRFGKSSFSLTALPFKMVISGRIQGEYA